MTAADWKALDEAIKAAMKVAEGFSSVERTERERARLWEVLQVLNNARAAAHHAQRTV